MATINDKLTSAVQYVACFRNLHRLSKLRIPKCYRDKSHVGINGIDYESQDWLTWQSESYNLLGALSNCILFFTLTKHTVTPRVLIRRSQFANPKKVAGFDVDYLDMQTNQSTATKLHNFYLGSNCPV